MYVVCNNKDKEWCPYGSVMCDCDVYYPYQLKDGENRYISCTDHELKIHECYLEEVEYKVDSSKKILEELKDEQNKCEELFNIAYSINNNENTRTLFSQKVICYMSEVVQTLGYLIGEIEEEEIRNKILEESYDIDSEYDNE